MAVLELDPELAPIADALLARSNGHYDIDFMRHLVAEVSAEFKDAHVHDFVSVLITKECTDELRRLQALKPFGA